MGNFRRIHTKYTDLNAFDALFLPVFMRASGRVARLCVTSDSSLKAATMAMKTGLLWVRTVRVGDLARASALGMHS